MRALVWHGPRAMSMEDVAVPMPGPGEVRVRVEAVGICGSELSGYLGHNALRVPPLVMGHEFSGLVVERGDSVRTPFPIVGQRVVVNPLLSCGACDACRTGRANLCQRRSLVGAHRPGAFAESVVVPAAACLALPEAVDTLSAAMVEPLACAVRAVSLAATGGGPPGRTLRVLGAGPIGLLCAVVARHAGHREVTVHDPNRARAAVAHAWGLDAPDTQPDAADAVIDAVGLELTRRTAVTALNRGGTAVFIGLHEPGAAFDGNDLVRDEKVVRGCFAYTPADFSRALELLADGLLPPPETWITVRPLDAGPASFAELTGARPNVMKIVLRPDGARPEGRRA